MARPLSETRRAAILGAAVELIAAQGTGAPTAQIAKAAKVSEGSLFTYFASKEELFNKLYLEIEADLAAALLDGYPADADPRERTRHLWDQLIAWGNAHPAKRRAIRILKVSDRVAETSRNHAEGLFGEVRRRLENDLAGHVADGSSMRYLAAMLDSIAETTLDFIARDPGGYERYREAGFELFWKGVAR